MPHLAHGRPNVVVFNEDIGLMTSGSGRAGAAARALWSKGGAPRLRGQPSPCAALAALCRP